MSTWWPYSPPMSVVGGRDLRQRYRRPQPVLTGCSPSSAIPPSPTRSSSALLAGSRAVGARNHRNDQRPPVIDEPVHEGGVGLPPCLLPAVFGIVPSRASCHLYHEISGHSGSISSGSTNATIPASSGPGAGHSHVADLQWHAIGPHCQNNVVRGCSECVVTMAISTGHGGGS
jgi:hypothetical protein